MTVSPLKRLLLEPTKPDGGPDGVPVECRSFDIAESWLEENAAKLAPYPLPNNVEVRVIPYQVTYEDGSVFDAVFQCDVSGIRTKFDSAKCETLREHFQAELGLMVQRNFVEPLAQLYSNEGRTNDVFRLEQRQRVARHILESCELPSLDFQPAAPSESDHVAVSLLLASLLDEASERGRESGARDAE